MPPRGPGKGNYPRKTNVQRTAESARKNLATRPVPTFMYTSPNKAQSAPSPAPAQPAAVRLAAEFSSGAAAAAGSAAASPAAKPSDRKDAAHSDAGASSSAAAAAAPVAAAAAAAVHPAHEAGVSNVPIAQQSLDNLPDAFLNVMTASISRLTSLVQSRDKAAYAVQKLSEYKANGQIPKSIRIKKIDSLSSESERHSAAIAEISRETEQKIFAQLCDARAAELKSAEDKIPQHIHDTETALRALAADTNSAVATAKLPDVLLNADSIVRLFHQRCRAALASLLHQRSQKQATESKRRAAIAEAKAAHADPAVREKSIREMVNDAVRKQLGKNGPRPKTPSSASPQLGRGRSRTPNRKQPSNSQNRNRNRNPNRSSKNRSSNSRPRNSRDSTPTRSRAPPNAESDSASHARRGRRRK